LIGHELSHGFFDPEGAKFDGLGNKKDWWTPESKANFQKSQRCLADQYSGYCYGDLKLCVDGNQTLDENAADLAGLKIAYISYQMFGVKKRLAQAPMFNSNQLFFLSFPLYFCGDQTVGSLKKQLLEDSHTPSLFRVNGALRNVPEFSAAFDCPHGSFMNPTRNERCVL
jgi:predicted metalloendopeptidase